MSNPATWAVAGCVPQSKADWIKQATSELPGLFALLAVGRLRWRCEVSTMMRRSLGFTLSLGWFAIMRLKKYSEA